MSSISLFCIDYPDLLISYNIGYFLPHLATKVINCSCPNKISLFSKAKTSLSSSSNCSLSLCETQFSICRLRQLMGGPGEKPHRQHSLFLEVHQTLPSLSEQRSPVLSTLQALPSSIRPPSSG